jgi:ZIP family zinc transporter
VGTGKIVLLGAIAGFTIFLGLPIGRMRRPAPRLRALLNATAIGILLFLFFDILEHAVEPIDARLSSATDHGGSWASFGWLAVVLAAGLGVGLLSLVYYDRWSLHRRQRLSVGPGAAAVTDFPPQSRLAMHSPARRLALFIAMGIGLHNFAEGLAIGQSAAAGEIALAVLLVIGFGLHNATEGFGIVGPLAAEADRPSWSLLGVLGLIGGGPTFIGTLVGQSLSNETVSVLFLSLAAGSILYVVLQLVGVATRMAQKEMLAWGVLLGLLAGFATDFIVTAAGA